MPSKKDLPDKRNRQDPRRRDPDTVRVSEEVARHVREGHPWIFRDSLQGRRLKATPTGIEVIDTKGRFIARTLFDGSGALALRVYSRDSQALFGTRFIADSVQRAASWRRALLDVGADSCLRVLSGDSEGIPAVNVDRYGSYLVVVSYSAITEDYLEPLIAELERIWHPSGIYLQRRYRSAQEGKARPGAELVAGKAAPPEVVVAEGRLRYVVDVTAPLGTGLFADMRNGRRAVARLAAGRSVLNCFSYTGAFSVVAAAHGASSVVSIDSASRAHSRARRNFHENGIDVESPSFEFVTGDTFATLARMASKGRRFDMVILDPPSFSTSKARPFTTQKDYAGLAAAALAVLGDGGLLCAATNTAKLTVADFDRSLARAAAAAERELAVIDRVGLPPDYPAACGFPEGNYLKLVIAQAR